MSEKQEKLKGISNKISVLDTEIKEKEKELLDLVTAHEHLLEINIGKQRKSKSLQEQAFSIQHRTNTLNSLKKIHKTLNIKLDAINESIRRDKLTSSVDALKKQLDADLKQIKLVQTEQRILEQHLSNIFELSGKRSTLYRITQLLYSNEEARQILKIDEILDSWSNVGLNEFDEIQDQIEVFNLNLMHMKNQLIAYAKNSRTFPTPKKLKKANQKLMDKHALRLQQAGREAKEYREKKHSTMKFFHQSPV